MEQLLAIKARLLKKPWIIPLIFIGFSLLIAMLVESPHESGEKLNSPNAISGIDTFIPRGFVLVPIEVQNRSSLDSLLGPFGVVDLYTTGESEALAKGLKILRSPRDPAQFAVLVPETESGRIVRASEKPFQVIVQNPDRAQAEVRPVPLTSRRIIMEN